MIRVSILYPNTPGHRFDFEHYLNVHMPEAERRLGAAMKGMSVERGLTGTAPDLPPAYTAMCHLLFESVDAFMAAFLPHADWLQGDIKNYTDVEPVIQFNQIEITR
ncbi:MAG TPA: EthD family reductase [Terriglobales bacterium]|nr:EthD family reductase [Terriglobales bacterium]